ncbi:MAG: sugar phosphate isomerase/epimerase [Xanthobacteraceae bacterium]|nr:sugar phosphate isomerase/epimerase [Xanthobacteraceae bacterium]MCW5682740.1 sugar phosphate isomerase/epimerase [Xanthobacteraceae bacterium]
MNAQGLSINLATVREQWNLGEAVEACAKLGIKAVDPWRDQVAKFGLNNSAKVIKDNGMQVTGYCRGGMFTASDAKGRAAAIDDNKHAIDEAAALGADCLVLVVGGVPQGSKDIEGARLQVAEGINAVLDHARAAKVPLAIEPLHPMYAADRACVNTLRQALDLAGQIAPDVGVAIDVYHVWWEPGLAEQIARAGREKRIFAHHICDWLVPTKDILLDRGMMGDGVIDLKAFRGMIEGAGFHGPQEVEIFSAGDWWKKPGEQVLKTCIERYNKFCK